MGNLNMPGVDKFMSRMFRKADGVVWDLMSGKIGVQTDEGIVTLEGEGEDARVNVNMFDDFGVALPAFAQSTPIAAVKAGDIIYSGKSKISWVVEVKNPGTDKITFRVIKPDGTLSSWNPPKVSMLGLESGVMVLRSLMTMLPGGANGLGQMQNMLLPMMMMGGDMGGSSMEKMMPLMLMSQMNSGGAAGGTADGGGMGQMMQTMMMMKMMSGDSGGSGNIFSNLNLPSTKRPFN